MRIKYTLLDRMKNLTSTEMDFLLYIARKQDLRGHVVGVHNQDVCRNTGMCKQSFYTAMRGLEKKGVIRAVKASEIDYDVTILDNDCMDKETGKFYCPEGYINLQRSIFRQKRFRQLKAKEKWMLMYFLHITHENSASYRIGTSTFYEKFTKLLGVTGRVIRSYLHQLREFFSIGIIKGIYFITYRHSVFEPKDEIGTERCCHENFVQAAARRNRIRKVTGQDIRDTAELVKQYRQEADRRGYEIFEVLQLCIQQSVKDQIHPKDRRLQDRYIHKLVRKALALD